LASTSKSTSKSLWDQIEL